MKTGALWIFANQRTRAALNKHASRLGIQPINFASVIFTSQRRPLRLRAKGGFVLELNTPLPQLGNTESQDRDTSSPLDPDLQKPR